MVYIEEGRMQRALSIYYMQKKNWKLKEKQIMKMKMRMKTPV